MITTTKMFRLLLTFVLVTLGSTVVKAQYDPMFTQYMFNEMFINPAYAGSKEAVSLTALHRVQWIGFDGAPTTTTFSAHAPLMKNKMGVGFSFLNEKIGVTNRQLIYGDYAYRFTLGKGKFSLGLMGGLNMIREDLLSVQTTQAGDQAFSQNIPNQMLPNFGFGMYYYTSRFYTGISIPRMIDNKLTVSTANGISTDNKVDVSRFHYYFVIGRLFDLGDNFKLKPQIMTKAVQNAPIEWDINVNALIKESLWLGASYRTGADVSAIVGYQFSPQFLASLSYDYTLTDIRNYNSGSVEVGLNYLFSFRGKKIVTPVIFNC